MKGRCMLREQREETTFSFFARFQLQREKRDNSVVCTDLAIQQLTGRLRQLKVELGFIIGLVIS